MLGSQLIPSKEAVFFAYNMGAVARERGMKLVWKFLKMTVWTVRISLTYAYTEHVCMASIFWEGFFTFYLVARIFCANRRIARIVHRFIGFYVKWANDSVLLIRIVVWAFFRRRVYFC